MCVVNTTSELININSKGLLFSLMPGQVIDSAAFPDVAAELQLINQHCSKQANPTCNHQPTTIALFTSSHIECQLCGERLDT